MGGNGVSVTAAARLRPSRWFTALSVIGALVYLLLGFGLPSWVGFLAGRNEGIHRIHDLASALVFGLIVPVAFIAQSRAEWRSVGMAMLALVGVLIAVILYTFALIEAGQATIVPILLILSIPALLLWSFHPERDVLWRSVKWPFRGSENVFAPSRTLLLVALAGALPLLVFAAFQMSEQYEAPAGDAHGVELHYAGMAVLAVNLAVGAGLAGIRPRGWRAVGRVVALSAVLLGLTSIAYPDLVSSFGLLGGGVIAAVGALFWVLVRREGAAR